MESVGIVVRRILSELRMLAGFAIYAVVFAALFEFSGWLFYLHYHLYSVHLIDADFFPINGKFQAYNPLRRILEGQFPGPDFVLYTGMGPTLATLAAMVVSQCMSFSCSVFWGNFLSLLATTMFYGWTAFLLLQAAAVPLARWFLAALAVVIGLVITVPLSTNYPRVDAFMVPFNALNSIGNSQLSLRTASAAICAILAFGIASCESSRMKIVLTVLSCGVLLVWSNDYGLFAAVAAIVVYGLTEVRSGGFSKQTIQRFLVTAILSMSTFFVLIAVVSGGHPLVWISRNILGVAQDQMWYYLPHKKVLTLADLLTAGPALQKLMSSLVVLACLVVWRPRQPLLYSSGCLIFVTLCAGYASQVGGHLSSHYLAAFERTFWPAMLVWVVFLARQLVGLVIPTWIFGALFLTASLVAFGVVGSGLDNYRLRMFETLVYGKIHKLVVPKLAPSLFVLSLLLIHHITRRVTRPQIANVLVGAILLGYVTTYRRADGSNVLTPPLMKREVAAVPAACPNRNQTYVPALGGCLAKGRTASLANFALKTNGSSDVFSTYSSAFDVMVGAFNSSGSDYIIHALGEPWRTQYETALQEGRHEYVTTIREDFSFWESWVRRANWGAYSAILSNYESISISDYNLLWRRTESREHRLAPGTCSIAHAAPDVAILTVSPPAELQEPGYVDLTIEYTVTKPPLWRSPYVLQSYVTVQDGWGEFEGRFGIPSKPGLHAWSIPVEFATADLASEASPMRQLRVRAAPLGAAVTVSKCSSRYSFRKSRFVPRQEGQ